MAYRAPVADIAFTMKHVAGFKAALEDGLFGDLDESLVDAVLEEAGRFATDVLAPINRVGDREHPVLKDGVVTTNEAWRAAYRKWIEGGWSSLTGDPAFGGQGLPMTLQIAATDLWNQSNAGFALNPLLSIGAIEALEQHGTEELKRRYLPKLISGEWAGTMNLTEPQAGSDLGALRTRAEPAGDGSYRIRGQKIFITYGEHDLTGNIVHLVLARLPDAPVGTRGISLFLVPKFLVGEDGSLGERNDVWCRGIEDKLGIHASPTCTLVYGDSGGATGYLIGEEHAGLKCMFTMMNNARLAVGTQGAAIAERATQQAVEFAQERRQGRPPGWREEGMAPIIVHPDVKRMLLTMKTLTGAARAICYSCAVALDRAKRDPDASDFWQARADLMTPIAKAFSTDIGVEVASLGVQVHGGMGYVEETGAAQHLRDSRIFPIYEGTNGIQAIDLVTRKVTIGEGEAVRAWLSELRDIAHTARGANDLDLGEAPARLEAALDAVEAATRLLLARLAGGKAEEALAAATPYLRAFGLAAGGAYLVKGALAARGDDGATARHVTAARFYAENLLPGVSGLVHAVESGAASVAAASPELIAS